MNSIIINLGPEKKENPVSPRKDRHGGVLGPFFSIPCLYSTEFLRGFQSLFCVSDDSKQRLFIAAVATFLACFLDNRPIRVGKLILIPHPAPPVTCEPARRLQMYKVKCL